MNRKTTMLQAFLLPVIPLCGQHLSAQQKTQPNILCVVCEDISPFLGCYGDPVAQTPNLDRLASEGVRFTRMYTTVGVSAPSRAALITGMYPSSIGANNMRTSTNTLKSSPETGVLPYEAVPPPEVKCYTEYLRAAGYYCTNNAKTDYQFKSPVTAWDENGNKAHWKNRPEGMPFFAIFNLNVTHESQIWERANEPLTTRPEEVMLPPYYPDNAIVRRDMAIMYSNIHEMDKQVAQLIQEVEDAGLLDNTIIIWYSDNGGPLPRGKRELYETGTNVPFMVRYPDRKGSATVDDNLHMFLDIPASILSLAGIRPPAYMHGQAFLGQYKKKKGREYVYGARNRMDEAVDKQGAARDKQFRYIRNYMPGRSDFLNNAYQSNIPMTRNMLELYRQGKLNDAQSKWFKPDRKREEFYNVQKDPYELNNLIDDPAYHKEITRLRKAYDAWDKHYNAWWQPDERTLRSMMWPGGEQPVTKDPVFMEKEGKIALRSATPGASIAYQINGNGYKKGQWLLYTVPFSVKPGDVVTAKAIRIGYKESEVVTR